MKKIAKQLTDLVGNTPLMELSNYNKSKGLKARLIVKLESFNPAGSVKDRVALAVRLLRWQRATTIWQHSSWMTTSEAVILPHPQSAALFCPWLSDRKYSQHSSRALQQKINFLQTKTYYRTQRCSMR